MTIGQTAASLTERAVSIAHLVPQDDWAGTVHSVFASACNIAVGSWLLTVHDARQQHTPTSVRVETYRSARWAPRVRVGDRASLTAGRLAFGSHTLDLRELPVWTPAERLRSIDHSAAYERIIQLQQAQGASVRRPSSALASSLPHDIDALREIMSAPRTALQTTEINAVVRRMIGAGEGLTPTGDDVLVGLLSALSRGVDRYQGVPIFAPIAEAILDNLHRTTDVSAHYLRLATQHFFSEPLTNLLDAIVSGASAAQVNARTSEVLSVGATSGADALVGVLLGLPTALDFSLNKKAA